MKLHNIAFDLTVVSAVLMITSTPAFALSGCTVSPENPTLLLALLGAAVAFTPHWYQSFLSRK